MNENISLGRIAGIHVGFNWSLLVIAALIAWSLATSFLPSTAPGHTSGAYWAAGVISALVFLASLLAHELAHSIVAMRRGVKVEGITLWLFGGVSRFRATPILPVPRPCSRLWVLSRAWCWAFFSMSSQSRQAVAHIRALWPPLCYGWAT